MRLESVKSTGHKNGVYAVIFNALNFHGTIPSNDGIHM